MFAKPAPYTMTKEYQEQTNEFLKVRTLLHPRNHKKYLIANVNDYIGPELRPTDGYLVRRLLWQGPRAVSLCQRINDELVFSFVNRGQRSLLFRRETGGIHYYLLKGGRAIQALIQRGWAANCGGV